MQPESNGAARTGDATARSQIDLRRTESAYRRWQQEEGIPQIRGSFVPDLYTVEVAPWERLGQKAAFVNLADQQEDDGWMIEIAPGGQTKVLHHAFESSIYVVQGRGATTFWQDEGHKQTVEWQRGSVYSPPINCYYQHFNLDGSQPARLFAVTTAPMALNMYRSADFVFNNPYAFHDRYDGQDDYFSDAGQAIATDLWKTNFIPDVRAFKLVPHERGAGAIGMQWQLSNNGTIGHCSEFPAGTYKHAHRHGVGAHVIILDGEGYSLLWFGDEERRRVDWTDGTVISPREWEYHQHYNTGPTPARYIAFRLGMLDTRRPAPGQGWNTEAEINGIPYDEEDPAIYELYASECAKHGAKAVLPKPQYRTKAAARS